MLARRVIAISSDKAVAKQLTAGLRAAGGTVESLPNLDALAKGEIQAALVALHLDGENADALDECIERIRKDAWIIVISPKSDLKLVVAAMQKSERIAGVLAADKLSASTLAALCSRVLYGDIFGLEKVVPWGTKIYSSLVGDYQEKSICISQISEFAAAMGVRRKYRESIEQCTDELLMNALYDAPVDAAGNQLFADVPTKTRISLRMEQKAVVQYSCDGSTFTISVRDSFGTLTRETVLKYLHKCLYADQQIDRKAGGAGLGLYIMANATTDFIMNTLPGVATEVICTFDLNAPKIVLNEFGYFNEKIDAAGRLVGGRSKLVGGGIGPTGFPVERRQDRPQASKAVLFGLSGAIVLLLALIALVAYPRFAAAPTASLIVTTTPPDARIEVEGRERGTAVDGKLVIEDLEAGRAYKITGHRDGWESATEVAEPAKDHTVSVTVRLQPKATIVYLDSDPQGATVLRGDEELGVTPLSVESLPPSEQVDLVFRKIGYRDTTRALRVPRPGAEASLSVALSMSSDFGSVRLTSDPPGAQVLQNGELLAGVVTPVEEHLVQADRKYTFTLKAPGRAPVHVAASVNPGDRGVPVHAALPAGGGVTVTANIEGRASVVGSRNPYCRKRSLPMRDCPLKNGSYKLEVEGTRPYASVVIPFDVKDSEVVQRLRFGFVEAATGCAIELRRGRTTRKAAYLEGTHSVPVTCGDGAERKVVEVRVTADRTANVP